MLVWSKAKKCDTSACVEVAPLGQGVNERGDVEIGFDGDNVWVRNVNHPDEPVHFTREEWEVFCDGVVAGDFS
jgi:hypothetical protein